MSQEKKKVGVPKHEVRVTPAQLKLLNFCNHIEAADLHRSLIIVHDNATYFVDKDMASLPSSYLLKTLYEIIEQIAQEQQLKQTA